MNERLNEWKKKTFPICRYIQTNTVNLRYKHNTTEQLLLLLLLLQWQVVSLFFIPLHINSCLAVVVVIIHLLHVNNTRIDLCQFVCLCISMTR